MLDVATSAGRDGLAALRAAPGRALVALDYDGTLAPIVDRPEHAVPADGAGEVLADLAGRVARVALVTGRPAADVVALGRLDAVPGLVVQGQYGAQRWEAGRLTSPEESPGVAAHDGRLVLELRPPGFDKAGALLALCDPRPSAVLFAGDDVGDLAGFDAVDRLRAEGVPGLLVCSGSDEGPPQLHDRADVVVDGPAGVVDLLRQLVAALRSA